MGWGSLHRISAKIHAVCVMHAAMHCMSTWCTNWNWTQNEDSLLRFNQYQTTFLHHQEEAKWSQSRLSWFSALATPAGVTWYAHHLLPFLSPSAHYLSLYFCKISTVMTQGEGFLRASCGDSANVISAGSKPVGYVHPLAVQVMGEAGIDISSHTSKSMSEFLGQKVEIVISVCGNADQVCPTYPGQSARYHWPFDDPAHATGTDEEILNEFRRVRDEIKVKFTLYGQQLMTGNLKDLN